ncbi:MAG: hypothetical protein HKN76_13075, partial [Saprospiraceae bacterium]|nr:hypothetical protein [Saprospiraceae bacterium]
LNTISRGGDYKPTKQSYAVKEELSNEIDLQLGKLSRIMEEDLPKFNAAYKALNLDPLQIKSPENKSEGP